jgi:Ion channel/Bacterial regulatory proteins, gntR family
LAEFGLPDLARQYNLNQTSINRAIALLRAEGLVRVEHGRGAFVQEIPTIKRTRRIPREDQAGSSFAEEMRRGSVPLFLLLFASSYVVMARMSASNFGERLTHTDGLYFTVTVFSTVGFGDITAKSQAARLVVTGQIIADLVILGLAIKVIVGAVSRRRQPADIGGAQPSQEIATSRNNPAGHDP